MSLLSQLLKPGFTAIGAITGDPFTMAGLPYFGTFDAERLEVTFADMSGRQVVQRSCLALKSQWIAKPNPELRPEIVFGPDTYVLTAIAEDGVHYVLTLEKRT
jgi:hypothetical protein